MEENIKMKKLNALLLTAALFLSVSVLAGCESRNNATETVDTGSELTDTQKELEQIKKDSTELEKYVTNLKQEINNLKIENQKLIAQSKRLEAEIIDLKLELGQIPDSDSAGALEKEEGTAPGGDTAAQTENTPAAEESPEGH